MRLVLLSVIVATATVALPAGAQVYRWVDELGVVNYAGVPPGRGIPVTRLEAGPVIPVTLEGGHSSVRTFTAPFPVSRPALPPLPPPAPSAPPGNVDRATIEALGQALAVRDRCSSDRPLRCAETTAATSAALRAR